LLPFGLSLYTTLACFHFLGNGNQGVIYSSAGAPPGASAAPALVGTDVASTNSLDGKHRPVKSQGSLFDDIFNVSLLLIQMKRLQSLHSALSWKLFNSINLIYLFYLRDS